MRRGRIVAVAMLLLATACTNNDIGKKLATEPIREPLESTTGDFNGDGQIEDATLYHIPAERDSLGQIVVDENFIVTFSADSIAHKSSTHRISHITTISDIDHDGKDELGLYHPYSKHTSWGDFSVYSLRGGAWQKIASTTLNIDLIEDRDSTFCTGRIIVADTTSHEHIVINRHVVHDGTHIEVVSERVGIK